MKIYVLFICHCYEEGIIEEGIICVSEDINKIRISIYENFDIDEDYPRLEIWRYGENIYNASGDDVFEIISQETNNKRR